MILITITTFFFVISLSTFQPNLSPLHRTLTPGIIAIQAGISNVIFNSFSNYYDSKHFYTFKFSNFLACFYSMFIYMTRDNSPNIFMKYYPDNFGVSIGFMIVIWFLNLILVGLLAGIAYYKLKRQMAKEILHCLADSFRRETYLKMKDNPLIDKAIIKKVLSLKLANRLVPYTLINAYVDEKKHYKPSETKASEYIFGVLKKMTVYEFVFSSESFIF